MAMIENYPIRRLDIGSGEEAAKRTLELMSDIIKQSAKNWRIRETAVNIVKHLKSRDQVGEVSAIFEWVRNNTRFVRDIDGVELLHSPLIALDKIVKGDIFSGDCDDLSILTASLLKSIGYPVALRVAAYNQDKTLSHVYGLVKIKDKTGEHWIPFDAVLPKNYPLGWQVPIATRINDYII